MADLKKMDNATLKDHQPKLLARYDEFKSKHLDFDMTRGKPCAEQLDLSLEMLDCVTSKSYKDDDGADYRNYGGLDGIPEAKRLFAEYLDVEPDEVIIDGNSSLALMHDTLVRIMLHGTVNSDSPWGKRPKIKFLCPSPGYDRHFFICEYLNIEMIPIEMNPDGPDIDAVEAPVAEDESIKGIWCVPKYSNPTGVVYSDEVVERMSQMKTKAADFRIFWDNAYTVHHLTDTPVPLKNILTCCKQAGNAERVLIFGSTSKISLPGAGISMMAGSQKNMMAVKKQLGVQTIGPDKINQLRHVRFFKNMTGIHEHMKKHAAIIKPKFDVVENTFQSELEDKQIAAWSRPSGGYFVSINVMDGCAKKVVKMAADAGVKLTPAGATYPYQADPKDRNIRIAPTFPPIDQVEAAMELVAVCIQLVSIEKLMETD